MMRKRQDDLVSTLSDPLSEITRKERRSLLGLSTVGLAMALLRFLPAEITAMSIKFNNISNAKLMLLIACIILYYLIAFILYFRSDHLRWKIAMKEVLALGDRQAKAIEGGSLDEWEHEEKMHSYDLYGALYKSSRLRGIFEFYIPIAIAVFAMTSLAVVSCSLIQ